MSEYIGEILLKKAVKEAGEVSAHDRYLVPSELISAIGRHRFDGIIKRINASPIGVVDPCYAVGNYWGSNGPDQFLLCNSFMAYCDEADFEMVGPIVVEIVNFMRVHMICRDALKWEPNLYVRVHAGCGVMAEVAIPVMPYLDNAVRFATDLLDRASGVKSVEEAYCLNVNFKENRIVLYKEFNDMVTELKEKERG